MSTDTCESGNSYNGEHFGARILAVFVVFAVSALGSFLPLLALRSPFFTVPPWCFFVTRYIGSGVIVATGFIHLLAEAGKALLNPCLGGVWEEYTWAEGICLMGVFTMFFFDIVAHKKIEDKVRQKKALGDEAALQQLRDVELLPDTVLLDQEKRNTDIGKEKSNMELDQGDIEIKQEKCDEDVTKVEKCEETHETTHSSTEHSLHQQILNSFVLEFGIIFHSVFVGLSLAIAGDEFKTLYAAIAFHQMFEGLGLGTRFAMTPWPKSKWYVPWVLSLAYSLTTPVAIAIGLGVRKSYPPGSRTALITTGVFDAVCAGVLIYNSLVELMAYDFMYSREFSGDKGMGRMLTAFFFLSVGGFAMALIGKWA